VVIKEMNSKARGGYDYITKLCRQQAEVVQIMIMKMFAILDWAKPDIECIRAYSSEL
jgi:hypothetical protein